MLRNVGIDVAPQNYTNLNWDCVISKYVYLKISPLFYGGFRPLVVSYFYASGDLQNLQSLRADLS